MTNVVEVRDESRTRIGAISFDPSPARLSVQRTAAGFELTFPVSIALEFKATSEPQPLVTDLSATVMGVNEHQNGLVLGRARHGTCQQE